MASELKDRILTTASELFYSQGIKATGIDSIVKAAGTTKMSLYKYFPSKDDLAIAFLRKRDEEFRQWFAEQMESHGPTPRDKLLGMFDIIGEWLNIEEFRGCAFINTSAEFPKEEDPIHQLSAEFYSVFRAYIADIATQAGAAHPNDLAQQLALLVEGAIVSEQMKRGSGSAKLAKNAAEILIDHSLNTSH